jgi:hypothetical protein
MDISASSGNENVVVADHSTVRVVLPTSQRRPEGADGEFELFRRAHFFETTFVAKD